MKKIGAGEVIVILIIWVGVVACFKFLSIYGIFALIPGYFLTKITLLKNSD